MALNMFGCISFKYYETQLSDIISFRYANDEMRFLANTIIHLELKQFDNFLSQYITYLLYSIRND